MPRFFVDKTRQGYDSLYVFLYGILAQEIKEKRNLYLDYTQIRENFNKNLDN